jgi:hypothetical protein
LQFLGIEHSALPDLSMGGALAIDFTHWGSGPPPQADLRSLRNQRWRICWLQTLTVISNMLPLDSPPAGRVYTLLAGRDKH